jgi:DNA-binding GntR family transcriptional regulator
MVTDSAQTLGDRTFLSDEVASHIRRLIITSEYGPDEFIRAVPLAKQLGVSPTPVREALMALWQQGFLEQLPRRGFRVVPITNEDLHDLFEILTFLSGELAARAATHLTDADLTHLEEMRSRLASLEGGVTPDEIDALDYKFHDLINGAGGSPKYHWFVQLLYHYVPHAYFASPEYRLRSNAGHRQLMDALLSRDPKAARAAMEAHMAGAGRRLLEARGQTARVTPANAIP